MAGAFAEAVPLVKFAVKLLDGLTRRDDPEELGLLARVATRWNDRGAA